MLIERSPKLADKEWDSLIQSARNAGRYSDSQTGQTRATIIASLLDQIMGEEYDWSPVQCDQFFEALLKEYAPREDLELLLCASGLTGLTKNGKTAEKRRKILAQKNEKYDNYEPGVLARRENRCIKDDIVPRMEEDQASGVLREFVLSVYEEDELSKLGLITQTELAPVDGAPAEASTVENASVTPPTKDPKSKLGQFFLADSGSSTTSGKMKKHTLPKLKPRIYIAILIFLISCAIILFIANYVSETHNAELKYTLDLTERFEGYPTWTNELNHARPDDVIEFQVEFVNDRGWVTPILSKLGEKFGLTLSTKDIIIHFDIPEELEYIEGSTVLYNYYYQDGTVLDENGEIPYVINIGSYKIEGNAYVQIKCRVNGDKIEAGENEFYMHASAIVNGTVIESESVINLTY